MTSNTSDPSSVMFGMISKYKNEGIDSFLQIETCLAIYSRCQTKSKILEDLNFNIEKKMNAFQCRGSVQRFVA